MNESYSFELIDGSFSVEDARKIMIELIQSKINFHEREVLRLEEQGKNSAHSKMRIERLKKSTKILIDFFSSAKVHDKRLVVKSTVELSFNG